MQRQDHIFEIDLTPSLKMSFFQGGEFGCGCSAVHGFVTKEKNRNSFENFPFKIEFEYQGNRIFA